MTISVAMALFALEADKCINNNNELRDVYNYGIALIDDKNILNRSSSSSTATTPTNLRRFTPSKESSNLDYISRNINSAITSNHRKANERPSINEKILMLDLEDSWKIQHANLVGGVNDFFENRSQYSRLDDLEPPPYYRVICNDPECKFEMAHYPSL